MHPNLKRTYDRYRDEYPEEHRVKGANMSRDKFISHGAAEGYLVHNRERMGKIETRGGKRKFKAEYRPPSVKPSRVKVTDDEKQAINDMVAQFKARGGRVTECKAEKYKRMKEFQKHR